MTRRIIMKLILSYLCLCCFALVAKAQPKPPTIKVQSGYRVVPSLPGGESAYSYLQWTTTNCDYVLILGKDSTQYPPTGKIDTEGSYVFVAVGPGGTASQFAGAHLSMMPLTKGYGEIYKFSKEFNADNFFQNSYKESFSSRKSLSEFSDIIIRVLQDMQYTASSVNEAKAGSVVYTANFNYNKHLEQSSQERSQEGKIQRQIAYVISISNDPKSSNSNLFILPVVRRNFPRDNDKWDTDPDGLQLGIPACKDLAEKILNAAR